LEYFRSNRYRRYELTALSILARAHDNLGELDEAETLAEQALGMAEDIKDQGQIIEACENLAGVANARGALPSALAHRLRALEIRRRLTDQSCLAWDLTSTADLLIRRGRHDEAVPLLDEIDAGVTRGIDAYRPRLRRAIVLRALSAAIRHQAADVRAWA